ncbi:MAG: 50S ribosomal protein L15, partial [Candidatus Komeilibacteria bacterium]|nr:50S ribosomal protein L15 [Candidatus Komeilibacteria bacterium]
MALSLAKLQASKGAKKNRKRLGRGNASGKGTTAGRGTKGQRARSGGRSGLALKGLKFIIQRLPKNKGFKSHHPKLECVNVGLLEKYYQNNQVVTPLSLLKLGLL